MSVRIHLEKVGGVFTNLDTISGKIVLNLTREETFGGITVKLECESRTRLATPRDDRRDRYGMTAKTLTDSFAATNEAQILS